MRAVVILVRVRKNIKELDDFLSIWTSFPTKKTFRKANTIFLKTSSTFGSFNYILVNETVPYFGIKHMRMRILQSREEWQWVFLISSGIYMFGAIFYAVFASGERQPWAEIKDAVTENKNGCDNKTFDIAEWHGIAATNYPRSEPRLCVFRAIFGHSKTNGKEFKNYITYLVISVSGRLNLIASF